MKKLLLALIVAAALGAGFLLARLTSPAPAPPKAQEASQPAPGEPPAAPAEKPLPPPPGFALRPARHDFGKLFEGETRIVELAIDRPADKPLRMGRLYSPCPCIRVEAAPLTVEAGKPAAVRVVLHSLTLEGKKSFPAYVEILEPQKGVLRADVDVDVERVPARIMLVPETFHLGSISGDKTATVKFTNLTRAPLRILDATAALPGSKLEVKGSRNLPPGESAELQLGIAAAKLDPGPVSSMVTLKTDCPLHAEVRIPVSGTVAR